MIHCLHGNLSEDAFCSALSVTSPGLNRSVIRTIRLTFQFIMGELVMDTLKLLAGVHVNRASMCHNRAFATGMPAENARSIIHVAIDNDPAVVFSMMLLDFLTG